MKTAVVFTFACAIAVGVMYGISSLTDLLQSGSAPSDSAQLQIEESPTKTKQPQEEVVKETQTAILEKNATTPSPANEEPAAAAATINIAAGKKTFKKCKACHSAEKGAKNKVGPNLWNTVNQPIAAREGFKYSPAMAELKAGSWTVEKLDEFLLSPKKTVNKTKMLFAGIKKRSDRNNLIAWLAQQADEPISIEALGLATAAAATAATTAVANDEPQAQAGDEQTQEQAIVYRDPPKATEAELTEIANRVDALEQSLPALDYERARWHPIHFKPAIDKASDGECLVCHKKILDRKPLETAPAGINAKDALGWYQTLDTYQGDQQTFHYRHINSPFAKKVMNLKCNFCHQGNDPREESPGDPTYGGGQEGAFTLRKMVNPSNSCLRCHGQYDYELMGTAPWHEYRADVEDEETPNGCLTCHAETFRTNRHAVTYLNAQSIEQAAKSSSDVCFGCHGGRAWYRNSYPYPRNPFPDMDEEVPDWAKNRPTQSEEKYRLSTK